MAYELDRRDTYRFSAMELGPFATLQQNLAEALIAAEPHDLPNSINTFMGNRMVTVFGYGDLMIYLEVERIPNTVSLYLVVDRMKLPDWFVYPTGTWFENFDLGDS
jgi:hypothetical protein